MTSNYSQRKYKLAAPAKLNLFLNVGECRYDGYHNLYSLVAFTEESDFVTVLPSHDLQLSLSGPFAARLPKNSLCNLVMSVAVALCHEVPTAGGAHLHLEKNLPVASGIGGGSGDAAAAMKCLLALWEKKLSESRLSEIGLKYGADIPVCLLSRPALIEGIGEQIKPVRLFPPCAVVLVNSGHAVSTREVFSATKVTMSEPIPWVGSANFHEFVDLLSEKKNDLTEAACKISPVIRKVLTSLWETNDCALARMSGSGGTCFGLYKDLSAASKAARAISQKNPTWWCVATRLLASPPLMTNC